MKNIKTYNGATFPQDFWQHNFQQGKEGGGGMQTLP